MTLAPIDWRRWWPILVAFVANDVQRFRPSSVSPRSTQ
jgi:hypothetical protein